jgi:hypothetical protein
VVVVVVVVAGATGGFSFWAARVAQKKTAKYIKIKYFFIV